MTFYTTIKTHKNHLTKSTQVEADTQEQAVLLLYAKVRGWATIIGPVVKDEQPNHLGRKKFNGHTGKNKTACVNTMALSNLRFNF